MKLPTLLSESRYAIEEFEALEGRKPTAQERRDIIEQTWETVVQMREAYGEWKALPACECGLDDVTPETCPRHKNLV